MPLGWPRPLVTKCVKFSEPGRVISDNPLFGHSQPIRRGMADDPNRAASRRRHGLRAPCQRCPSHWQELSVIRLRDFGDAQSRLCARMENRKIWENQEMNNPRLFALREGVNMGRRAGCGIHRNETWPRAEANFHNLSSGCAAVS